MDTYKTLDQARQAKGSIAQYILEIEHRDNGHCFIGSKVPAKVMTAALANKIGHEITAVIADFDPRNSEQIAADNARYEAEADKERKCERCGCHVERTAYSQIEQSQYGPAITYYCSACHQLMTQIGTGEHTAMQAKTTETPDNTPKTKED
jgi:Zn finger protein HypA/HybF involved in hydrogenase expression